MSQGQPVATSEQLVTDPFSSPSLRLNNFPISSKEASPLIPDLFHNQKVYIFRALEQDAFPRFLRAKAFGNLTPLGSFARLIAGLFFLWGGFVIAFALIFLDFKPKITRLWVSARSQSLNWVSKDTDQTCPAQIILPFFLASNLLFSAFYSLSPLLAFLQQSETTPFRFIRIRESYVRKLLFMRALWIEASVYCGDGGVDCDLCGRTGASSLSTLWYTGICGGFAHGKEAGRRVRAG